MERLSKIIFAAPFIIFGVLTVMNWDKTLEHTTAAFTRAGLADKVSSFGLDMRAAVSMCLSIALFLQFSGGAAVCMAGDLCGGVMLALFLLAVTPISHYPFTPEGGIDHAQLTQVLKNVVMLGGAMFIAADGYSRVRARGTAQKGAGVSGVEKKRA